MLVRLRYTDFLVNEVSEQGQVLHLTSTDIPVEDSQAPPLAVADGNLSGLLDKVAGLLGQDQADKLDTWIQVRDLVCGMRCQFLVALSLFTSQHHGVCRHAHHIPQPCTHQVQKQVLAQQPQPKNKRQRLDKRQRQEQQQSQGVDGNNINNNNNNNSSNGEQHVDGDAGATAALDPKAPLLLGPVQGGKEERTVCVFGCFLHVCVCVERGFRVCVYTCVGMYVCGYVRVWVYRIHTNKYVEYITPHNNALDIHTHTRSTCTHNVHTLNIHTGCAHVV